MSSIASCVRSAFVSRFAAAPIALLPLLAAGAQAGEFTTNLQGKVLAIAHSGNPNAELQLAAKGVTTGAAITVKVVVEDTTPGVQQTVPYTYMQYDNAFVDVVATCGTWEAHLAVPGGSVTNVNTVHAANDANYLGTFDIWSGQVLGVDTDNILSQGSTPPYGTFIFLFNNTPPLPSTDDSLAQDLKKFKTEAQMNFLGNGGNILIDFTTPPAGLESALARSGQLKAAGKLGKSQMKGFAKFAANPDKDPGGSIKDTTLQKATDTFGTQFLAAIAKAAKKGGSAPLGESGEQEAKDVLTQGLQSQSDAITADEDAIDPLDRALRSKILKALGSACSAEFKAEARDVLGPNLEKLTNALNKARAKLKKAVTGAADAALKKGHVYVGPSGDAISADLDVFVQAFVDLTSTGVE